MSNSIQTKLIAISSQDDWQKPSKSLPVSFAHKMLHHFDANEAAQMVGEQAGFEFNRLHGGEIERLKLEQQEFDASYKVSKKRENQLEDKLRSTPQFIKSCPETSDDSESKNSKWNFYDKISMAFLIIAIPITMVMGASNLYTALVSSGMPIFLEQQWLAISLSMLVPAGSISLTFISHFLDYAQTKKRYALSIYTLCALSLLTWTVCFSISFGGVTGGDIDWDTLGESSSNIDILLAWTQISTEILATAALFLAAESIYLKYSPDAYQENSDYINARVSLKQHQDEHEALREKRGENHARLATLKAERQVFINEQIADYLALRARFNAFSNI